MLFSVATGEAAVPLGSKISSFLVWERFRGTSIDSVPPAMPYSSGPAQSEGAAAILNCDSSVLARQDMNGRTISHIEITPKVTWGHVKELRLRMARVGPWAVIKRDGPACAI